MLYGDARGPLTLDAGATQYAFGGITPPPIGSGLAEFADTLTNLMKSVCLAIQARAGSVALGSRYVTWSTEFPSAPSTITINLQGAMRDNDAEYATVDTSTNAAGEARTIANPTNLPFWRVQVSATTGGTLPTIICKVRSM